MCCNKIMTLKVRWPELGKKQTDQPHRMTTRNVEIFNFTFFTSLSVIFSRPILTHYLCSYFKPSINSCFTSSYGCLQLLALLIFVHMYRKISMWVNINLKTELHRTSKPGFIFPHCCFTSSAICSEFIKFVITVQKYSIYL